MICTGENRNTRRKTCHIVTWFNTKPTWNLVESEWGLRDERPATDRPRHQSKHLEIHFVPQQEQCASIKKSMRWTLRNKMTAINCKNSTEYTYTERAQNAEVLLLKVAVRVLNTRF
jgi:hypothetical protein